MAALLLYLGRTDESIAISTKSIELYHENARAYYFRAKAQIIKHDKGAAIKDLFEGR
jgi:hypothetical protein